MAKNNIALTLEIPESLHCKLSLLAGLKDKTLAETAQEGLLDWFDTIGAVRIEWAIDREIKEINELYGLSSLVHILAPEKAEPIQ
jgi:hypothetical protein